MADERARVYGFTGTQDGLTIAQAYSLNILLDTEDNLPFDFHHGDCIGADAEAHVIARDVHTGTIRPTIFGHPCDIEDKRAHCKVDVEFPVKKSLDRNKDIVNASDYLIVCPKGKEVRRSGTWATVRYARKHRKMIIYIWPDGTMEWEYPEVHD